MESKNYLKLLLAIIALAIVPSKKVIAQADCSAQASFHLPSSDIYMGTTLAFENQSENANNYEWYVNDVVVSEEEQFSYYFNASGTFTVTLKAINVEENCFSQLSKEISVTRNLGDKVDGVSNSFPAQDANEFGNAIENKAFDRFGNEYGLKDLEIPNHSVIAGIFMLHFYDDDNNTGVGFDDATLGTARRNVVTQVFEDISALLMPTWNSLTPSPYNGTYYVEIDVRSNSTPNGNPMPTGALGVASQYYLDYGTGITYGEVWKTIKTGMNSYHGVIQQPSYHGYVAINFQGINWYTNLSSTAIGGSQYDLYTVTLHEALHALGFASLIGQSGTGFNGRYSIYDTYLKFGTTSLIGNQSSCYGQNFATSTANLVAGCNTVSFDGTGFTQDVHTPTTWANGSSLSHFNCINGGACTLAGNGYSMNFCSDVGVTQRYPHCRERQTLADLGYNVQNTYGNGDYAVSTHTYSSCPVSPVTIAGINDYNQYNAANNNAPFTVVSDGSSITFADFTGGGTPGILNNDNNAIEFSCVEVVSGGNSSNISVNYGTQTIIYTPPLNLVGNAILKYRPKHSSGKLGNVTYIFIQVTAPCNPTTCNLVCFGDFENFATGSSSLPLANIDLDHKISGSPNNSPDIVSNGSNQAAAIACNSSNPEALLFHLKKPIPPGCIANIKFKASYIVSGGTVPNGKIQIQGSDVPPCPQSSNNESSNTCGSNTLQCPSYIPTCMVTLNLFNTATFSGNWLSPINYNFVSYSIPYTNNTLNPIEWVVVNGGNSFPGMTFLYFDDFEITDSCQEQYTVTPTYSPTTPCPGGQVSISYTICFQGGGPSNSDTIFIGVDTTFSSYLSHAGGGNFNNQGQAMILPGALTTLSPCTTMVANVNISPNAPPGLPIQVNLNVDSDSACITSSANNPPIYIIPGPDSTLHINKVAVPPGPYQAGDTVEYKLVICNSSLNSSVTNIYISDTVPSQFLSSTINSSNMSVSGNILTAGPLTLGPGMCDTLSYTVELDTGLCGWVTNCAYIDSAEGVCSYVDSGCTDIFVSSNTTAPTAGKDTAYCFSFPMDSMYAVGNGCMLYWFHDSIHPSTFIDSGSSLLPPFTAPGTYEYLVVDSCNGCPSLPDTVTITIYSPPSLGPAGPFCVTDPPTQIPYSPTGGTFVSGVPGSVDQSGIFYPSIAGEGVHDIGYIYTDPNTGCTYRVNINITVYAPPVIQVPAQPICWGSPPFNLQASQPGGVWGGPAIVNSVTGLFDPSLASIGPNMVTYYIPGYVCADSSDTAYINVFPNNWQQVAGAPSIPSLQEEGLDVKTDKDGNVYVTGSCGPGAQFGTSTFLSGPGFLAKYDPCGALIWAVDLPNVGMTLGIHDGVRVYVAGGGQNIAFIEAYDPGTGTNIFSVTMPHSGGYAHIRSMELNHNNIPFVTGTFSGGSIFFPGWGTLNPSSPTNTEAFVARFDPTAISWLNVRHISTPLANGYVEGNGITIKPNTGRIYVVGNYNNMVDFGGISQSQSGYNSYLVRYNASLNPIISRTITNYVPNAVEAEFRTYYTAGEVIVQGNLDVGSFWGGNLLNNWSTAAPATESYFDVHLDKIEDKIYVTGADFSSLSAVVVREIDPSNGSLGWAEFSSFGMGNAKDYGKGVTTFDGGDFVYATGSYTGHIIFGSTTNHISSGGGVSEDIFTCRVHKGTSSFAKSAPIPPTTPPADPQTVANGVIVYPNTSTGEFTIEFLSTENDKTTKINMTSITGQTIISKEYPIVKGLNKLKLDATSVSSGMYFINLSVNGNTSSHKVVISKQ